MQSRPREQKDFALPGFRSAQQLTGHDSHQRGCAETQAAQDPGVICSVAEMSQHHAVHPGGQIAFRREISRGISRRRHKSQQRPINHQQSPRQPPVPARRQFHQRYRGNQITRRNGLQRVAVELEIIEFEQQQVPLRHHSQDPQDCHPTDHLAVDAPLPIAPLHPLADGERHCCPDNKQEQRHDQVPTHKTLPRHMLELPVEPRRQRVREQLAKIHHHRAAAHNPKNIESPQRIDRCHSTGKRFCRKIGFPLAVMSCVICR